MKSDSFDEIFSDDNLIVLQLIADWENIKGGNPMPEKALETALQKVGFEWNLIRIYSSITKLSIIQIIRIKQQGGQVCYQINEEVTNWMLETAIKKEGEENDSIQL